MAIESNKPKQCFTLLDGDVRVWIEQEGIHILAAERSSGDPVELTENMAIRLSLALKEMADRLNEE